MDIDVCMPWRSTPDREPAFRFVTAWWQRQRYRVILGDTDHQPFSAAAARNSAVKASTASIVIVADADTIPDPFALDTAILACSRHGGVWWPFTEYRYLTSDVNPGDELDADSPHEQVFPNSVGGLMVIRRDDYWQLGGQDERFQGWGGEDRAFELVARELSSLHRVPGVVYAFNHYADRNMRGPWRPLLEQYRSAARQGRLAEYIASRPPSKENP